MRRRMADYLRNLEAAINKGLTGDAAHHESRDVIAETNDRFRRAITALASPRRAPARCCFAIIVVDWRLLAGPKVGFVRCRFGGDGRLFFFAFAFC